MGKEIEKKLDEVEGNWQAKNLPTENVVSQLQNNLLVSEPKNFASFLKNSLEEKFGGLCTVEVKEKWGFFKVCINAKNQPVKSTSQVEITITKDLKCNVHLNDYAHYEDYYFYGEKLTKEEVADETKNLDAFLRGEDMAADSRLKKIEYGAY